MSNPFNRLKAGSEPEASLDGAEKALPKQTTPTTAQHPASLGGPDKASTVATPAATNAPTQPAKTSLAQRFAPALPAPTTGQPEPSAPAPSPPPEDSDIADDSDLDDLGSIQDLAGLDASEDLGQAPRGMSQFQDETPATKPMRELPEGLDRASLQFIDLVDGVYEILYDPELLGAVMRNIMIELKGNPQYMRLVAKDDVRTFVQAMRNTMGLAKIKKAEKAPRGKAATTSKGKANDSEMDDAFAELGIEI